MKLYHFHGFGHYLSELLKDCKTHEEIQSCLDCDSDMDDTSRCLCELYGRIGEENFPDLFIIRDELPSKMKRAILSHLFATMATLALMEVERFGDDESKRFRQLLVSYIVKCNSEFMDVMTCGLDVVFREHALYSKMVSEKMDQMKELAGIE